MSRFKPGDVVICIKVEFGNETVGKKYLVIRNDDDGWFSVEKDDNGSRNAFLESNFISEKEFHNKEFSKKVDDLINE